VAGAVSISESGLLAFFVPNAALSAGSLYTIRVDGITDLAGNALPLLTSTFTTYPAPTITGFAPAQGPAGTAVTISGEHFDADVPENNTVTFFDGNEAAVSEATTTTLKVTVPSGAINGPITVSTPGGTATSTQEFIVALPPTIAGFSPTSGFVGATVTISGADFDAIPSNNIVRFNGVAAALESATTTVLTVKVPAGAASGPLSVTTPGGTATTADHFIVNPKPEISSVTPGSGTVGTAVTVTGLNFNSITPSDNQISFNGTGSIITSVTATTLTTIVPLGATTGPITVTNSGGTAMSALFTVLPKQDFSITASPAQTSVIQGKTTTYQIQVNSTAGDFLTHFVQLSAANLPTGVTAAFSPPQISGGQVSTLTVTTTAGASAGNIGITISGTASLEGRTVVRQATLQLLVVASGGTTLSGRVLASKDDRPIAGAKLKLGGQVATTDESGNFLFANPPIGDQVILLDGPTLAYPADLPVPVTIATGVANDLLYPIYLHEVSQEYVTIVPGQEAIVNPPNIPDFSMHIPQGTTIVGWDGQPNTQVSVTPVPIDRLPIRPIPEGVQTNTVYMFNFNKPGGGYPTRPIPIVLPNDLGGEPGDRVNLWYYDESPEADPNSNQWRIYGQGTISQDGRTIIPDPGVGQPKFCCGGGFASLIDRIVRLLGADGPEGGDPVDLSSGIFILRKTDMVLPGLIPIEITRTYRPNLSSIGSFGFGGNFNYDLSIRPSGSQALSYQLPNGNRYTFSQQPDGSYVNSSFPFLRGVIVTRLSDGKTLMRLRDGTLRTFNAAGSLTEVRDRNSNRIIINRSGTNEITQIMDASGRAMTLSYEQRGSFRLISFITDPIGRVVRYGYDGSLRLTTITDPAGGVTTYTYDADNRIASITDARGILFLTNEYDINGRVIKQTQADGSLYSFRYTLAGTTVTQTEVTDPNGNTTTYRFNGRQYLMRMVDAQGQMTRYDRDFATNQIMAIHDPLNRKTAFTYDLNGNQTSIIDPAGNVTLKEYEPTFNQMIKRTSALNQTTQFSYDPNGNLISTTDPLGNQTASTYNETGLPITIIDALGNTTHFEYDDRGNLISTIDPLGNKTQRDYDLVSRLIFLTDANGKTTRYSYDLLNRVTQIEDALSGLTNFAYDPNGNLLSVTDAKGQTTTHAYDAMDRLETRTDPLNRVESYSYDPNGNLKTFTDRKGQVTTFSYDDLNRRTSTSFADGTSTVFTYNTMGKLVRLADSVSGEIELGYDPLLDRLMRETTPLGTIEYGYDALSRRTMMTVNGRAPVSYNYDAASRLTQVSQESQVVGLAYDAIGRRSFLSYPNGTLASYSYDAASRLTNILHQSGTITIENLGYSYDAAGNRIGLTRADQTAALLPEPVQALYDVANEQIQFNNSTPNLTYDANGNLLSQIDVSGTTTYTWDARNRLTRISGPEVSASFVYDAMGRRVSKTINGVRTDYQYDGNDIVAEIGGGAVVASYLRSLRVDEPFIREGSISEYYHADALGSALRLTDASGAVTTSYGYTAFGMTMISGTSTNPFQYTGRENDGTGLHYYRARYYSPTLHRFISEDPRIMIMLSICSSNPISPIRQTVKILLSSDPTEFNLYQYAKDNPLLFIDSGGTTAELPRFACPRCPAAPPNCSLERQFEEQYSFFEHPIHRIPIIKEVDRICEYKCCDKKGCTKFQVVVPCQFRMPS
jgi:RHS repeat-associated protein